MKVKTFVDVSIFSKAKQCLDSKEETQPVFTNIRDGFHLKWNEGGVWSQGILTPNYFLFPTPKISSELTAQICLSWERKAYSDSK